MKKIITFFFASILFQNLTFCQTQEELDLEMEEDLNEVRIKVNSEEEKIFKVVKNMYRFPGCDGQGKSKKELEMCSENKIQQFIHKHLKYPAKARENLTQGIVMVEFTVKRSKVEQIKLLQDIGNGCGQEAVRVIELMNELKVNWIPGCSRCRPFTTKFTIPISFQLFSNTQKK